MVALLKSKALPGFALRKGLISSTGWDLHQFSCGVGYE